MGKAVMREEIIDRMRKMLRGVSDEKTQRIRITVPGDGEEPGELVFYHLAPGLVLLRVRIRSLRIPRQMEGRGEHERILRVNFCERGRCELRLQNGENTYLCGGEVSIDTDHAQDVYYYPTALYDGIELLVYPDLLREGSMFAGDHRLTAAAKLTADMERLSRPSLARAGDELMTCLAQIGRAMDADAGDGFLWLKSAELLELLREGGYTRKEEGRRYYPAAQVRIAKAVHDILTADPSVRYSSAELAARFGISDTSLKNYFKNTFGCGYREYQDTFRMKHAAMLLETTSKKILDIAHDCGYASQTKFAAAFRRCYGMTPMDYRREHRWVTGEGER